MRKIPLHIAGCAMIGLVGALFGSLFTILLMRFREDRIFDTFMRGSL